MKNFSFLLNGLLLCGLAEIHAAQPVERAQNFQSTQSSGFIKPAAQTSLADSEVIPSSPGDADLGEQWLLKYKEISRGIRQTMRVWWKQERRATNILWVWWRRFISQNSMIS